MMLQVQIHLGNSRISSESTISGPIKWCFIFSRLTLDADSRLTLDAPVKKATKDGEWLHIELYDDEFWEDEFWEDEFWEDVYVTAM